MDTLGWIVVAILLLLFGKNFQIAGSITQPLGNTNAVPTGADNLPVISDQDTTDTPANQPAPWQGGCASYDPAVPVVQPIFTNPLSSTLPFQPTRVTFTQGSSSPSAPVQGTAITGSKRVM